MYLLEQLFGNLVIWKTFYDNQEPLEGGAEDHLCPCEVWQKFSFH
jgi:hypothetical protein